MIHRERALAENRRHHRRAHLLREFDEIVRRLEAMNLDAGDQHRLRLWLNIAAVSCAASSTLRASDSWKCRRPSHSIRSSGTSICDRPCRDEFRHSRALLGPDAFDDAMQFSGGGARIGQHRARASHLIIDATLRFDLARLVVNESAELALLLAWTS